MRVLGPAAIVAGVRRRLLRSAQDAATYLHYRKVDYRSVAAADVPGMGQSLDLLSDQNVYLGKTRLPGYLEMRLDRLSDGEKLPAELQLYADSVAAGQIPVYGSVCDRGPAPDWSADVTAGGSWPKLFFTRYRNLVNGKRGSFGDYRHTWELNRHQHLLLLSLAYRLTGDRRHLDCITCHISTWISDNPPFRTINWMSSMELGLRTVSWCLTLTQLDSGALNVDTKCEVLRSIYQQMRFLMENLSVEFADEGSSTVLKNNHTILEICCVLIVASCLPPLAESIGIDDAKKEDLRRLLLVELDRQTSADGMQVEQASSYLRFVLEALLLTRMFLPDFDGLDSFIHGYMRALNGFRYAEDRIFLVGDEDNGHVLLTQSEIRPDSVREVLDLYSVIYDEEPGERKAATRYVELIGAGGHTSILKDSGHWLCREVSRSPALNIYFRAGRMDFPTIPGYAPHAHCDLLSLNLSMDEQLWLVDRGTYTYGDRALQDEFRRGPAHNTVIVEGFEQMRLLGAFHSDCHSPCEMIDSARWTAKGVMTLARGDRLVEVTRTIKVDAESRTVSVHDMVKGLRGESVYWVLNLHPAVTTSNGCQLSRQGSSSRLRLSGWEEAEQHVVDYSPRYGVRESARQLRLHASGTAEGEIFRQWQIQVISGD